MIDTSRHPAVSQKTKFAPGGKVFCHRAFAKYDHDTLLATRGGGSVRLEWGVAGICWRFWRVKWYLVEIIQAAHGLGDQRLMLKQRLCLVPVVL